MIQINLFTKEKQTHREQIYGYWGKGWRGGIVRVWDGRVQAALFKMDN